MQHISVIILSNKRIFFGHSNAFRNFDGRGIICFDDGMHLVLVQIFKGIICRFILSHPYKNVSLP